MRYPPPMSRPPFPFEPPDRSPPDAAARSAMAPPAPKRFWREVSILVEPAGFGLALDGRPARTPGRRPLTAPHERAAAALAGEWRDVGDRLDPGAMPLTRLLNSAIDGVADHEAAVRADIVKYAGSDALCYRAAEPVKLVERQSVVWDPVLDWFRDETGARFALAEGLMFVAQPPEALAAVGKLVDGVSAPHQLAALHSITTLTGSALLALALERRAFSPDAVWVAAHVDEDVQMEIWGADDEALERRAHRRRDFDAAALVLAP